MQVRLFSYFLEKDDAQEYPDDDANQNQKPIHEACARFRFFMQVLGYIVLEEQIDGGYGGACQQQQCTVFRRALAGHLMGRSTGVRTQSGRYAPAPRQ